MPGYWSHDSDDRRPARPAAPAVRPSSRLPWLVFGVGTTLLTLFDVATSSVPSQWAYVVVVAALATLVLLRRVPAWALSVTSLVATAAFLLLGDAPGFIGTFGLGESFALLVVIVVTVRRASTPRGWAVAASAVAALLAVPVRILSYDALTYEILLVGAAGCAVAAGTVLKNMDGERLLALAVATQEQRDGLARDLHDDFTNRVASTVLLVQALRRSPEGLPRGLDDDLARVEESGAEALAAMRRWVSTLRADGVEQDQELREASPVPTRLVLDQWEAMTPGGRARFVDGTRSEVPADVRATVHRIVQEAVTNVARHAPDARWIDVSFVETGTARVLEIVNPSVAGAGADPLPGSAGLGIISMRERARLHDGVVEVGPTGSSTWSVRATFPLGADS